MLCVILSHPYLHRRKVEEVESGRDSEVATGLLSTSPFEQTDRSRPRTSWPARPWGYGPRGQGHVLAAQRSWTYTLMLNAAACCSFLPLDCWGDHGDPCQSTFQSGWQSGCGHKFSFDFCYISHYYLCIATQTTSKHSYFKRSTALGQFYLSMTE